VLVIEGSAGIGKTALLNAACATAQRNRRLVVRGRGSELKSGLSFGIVLR
jgi:predicted ATPase